MVLTNGYKGPIPVLIADNKLFLLLGTNKSSSSYRALLQIFSHNKIMIAKARAVEEELAPNRINKSCLTE